MGIFNFLKEAGQKLFHTDHNTPETTAASSGTDKMAEQIQQYIEKLGLGIQSPKVTVEGDKAILEGMAPSAEALEKAILAVGNTAGIAQVDARVTHEAGSQSLEVKSPQFYTVKKGDTLSKIAKEVYGNANRYNEIFEANRPMLKTADDIYPGQQLRIPNQSNKAAA